MKISNIIEGTFKDRPNRFTVTFQTSSTEDKAHLRDPGRLKELLIPGAKLLLRPALNPESRKTKYDVIAVWSEGIWVLINSGFHSDLAEELIKSGKIPELSDYSVEKREYTFGQSRLDFLLNRPTIKEIPAQNEGETQDVAVNTKNKMLLEVKGCTLVEDGQARFPDAPTTRGKRHLEELIKAKKEGINSAVLFLIPREDAQIFSPNCEMDPDFSQTLHQAEQDNVLIIAYSFTLTYQKNELELEPLKEVKIRVKP
ncbi:DNA/RNA nuclease SfsA [Methanobacterium sp. BAmetb5]|uniref:DNA/RNA nuclease SfsA n=1 Tax=Methanobacterium sp. BAmetb5 TaxID=2025351 RepID=UPI000E933925|nr:DNA/RNA nuclease SfsA [Methanobacterium sp. BAmetb5]AXV40047.1 MAG: sugar fermentation stimulation protein SfsA [Methanobacterium sp. BAmetb5]